MHCSGGSRLTYKVKAQSKLRSRDPEENCGGVNGHKELHYKALKGGLQQVQKCLVEKKSKKKSV